jgi:predicted ATPase/DNA-binding SARP family transcriptional activator
MGRVEFRLLGPLEVVDEGRRLTLGGKQRALLALFLLHAGEVVSRDRLIEGLWRDSPTPGAEATLRAYLSRLRSELGAGRVVRRSPGYLLALDPGELDASRFVQLAGAGREALARGRAGEAADLLRSALALWRGPVAEGDADELPVQAEVGMLEDLRLGALEDRLEADLQLGGHDRLVGELEALVDEHPLRERLWGQLMVALYRSQRQADALEAYARARTVLTDELGLEPGPELHALQQAILRHELPAAESAAASPSNLPAPLTSFIGREEELAEVQALLRQHRLVTVTGVGGVGKSRLALEAGRAAVGRFREGVWLVELAPLADPKLLPQAVVEAIGVGGAAIGSPLELLKERLGQAEMLLLLDNCEHLLDAAAELAEQLLSVCEGLRVLVTSRESFGAPWEAVYQLPPLPLPGEDAGAEELARCAPIRLFLERGSSTRADVTAEPDLPSVARICRELDGLPLAIELAAARTALLSPAEIAERLDDRFRFLRYWRRVTPARHQTLLATMDWSYELLDEQAQALLRRLAVFAGGFTLPSAVAVCFDGDEPQALEQVGALIDASLVVVVEREGASRYRLLETVRQYAAERLEQTDEGEEFRRRHAEFFLGLAESANLFGEAEGPQRHDVVIAEQANLRAAIEWALAVGDVELALRLAVALENFWVTRNPFEGMRLFERLLERNGAVSAVLRARVLRAYGGSSQTAGRRERAEQLYEQSLAGFRALNDERGTAILTFRLGLNALDLGDAGRARPLLEQSLELFRLIGSRRGETQALGSLGSLERAEGNTELAAALWERSAGMAAEIGRAWWEGRMLANLAALALEAGRLDEAAALARDALRLARRTGDRHGTVYALAYLAWAAAEGGGARRAGRLWGAVEAEERRGRVGGWEDDRDELAGKILSYATPAFERARRDGAGLTLDEAIEEGLRVTG